MTHSGTRRLVLMRHAKAEASAASDYVRELTDRGRRQSLAAGARLADESVVPEVVLVSSAARALSTWSQVLVGLSTAAEPQVRKLDSLYEADAPDVLAVCAEEVPADVTTVLVVGHNPTIAEAADLVLAGPERVELSFPTAAYAVFGLDCAWADLAPGAGRLLDAYAPQS